LGGHLYTTTDTGSHRILILFRAFSSVVRQMPG